jgi:hypothetical protein
MDYSIRPVDPKTHSIAPRRKRDGERAPFDFGAPRGEAPAGDGEQRRPSTPPETLSPEERAIAPPGDGETGAQLDLSA